MRVRRCVRRGLMVNTLSYSFFFQGLTNDFFFFFSAATPGYFTTTFVNGIKLETTSTRRAGLIRFTYPATTTPNLVVVDLTNDLQRSFSGGEISVEDSGRVKLGGTFLQVNSRLFFWGGGLFYPRSIFLPSFLLSLTFSIFTSCFSPSPSLSPIFVWS